MNSFRQHIPNFVDIDHPAAIPFATTADLLALEVVQRYKHQTFSHFAMSDNALMVIEDNGFTHWVVGFIKHPEAIELPQWTGWKHLVRLPDGREVVLTDEVVSSCGGRLTLRDGTVGQDIRYEQRMAAQQVAREKRDRGICPTCDVPFHCTQTPDPNGMIRVEQVCETCGMKMTSWLTARSTSPSATPSPAPDAHRPPSR